MKITVTGEKGFIGSSLCSELKSAGHEVITIKERIENSTSISSFGDFDCLIHLAYKRFESYEHELDYNLCILEKCLEMAAINHAPVLLASSAAVYGPYSSAVTEEAGLKPQTRYGKVKLILEQTLAQWSRKTSLSSFSIRIFNPYGIFSSRPYLISDFINHCLKKSPFEIKYPEDKRDFILITEAVIALRLFAEKIQKYNQIESFNLGSGRATAVKELIPLLEKSFNTTADVSYGVGHSSHPISYANISKLCEYLGWGPTIDISSGLKILSNQLLKNSTINTRALGGAAAPRL